MNQRPDIEVRISTREGLTFTTKTLVSYSSTRSLNDAYSVARLRFEGIEVQGSGDPAIDGREWWGRKGVLKKKDLVGIYLRDHNGKLWPDVIGMVSSITVDKGESFGVPQDGVQIEVHGLGRALSDYRIFFHPQFSNRPGLMFGNGLGVGLIQAGNPPSGRPDQVCKTIFERYFNKDFVFKLADGRKLPDAIRLDFAKIQDSFDKMAKNINGQELSVWDALRKFCDAPWNELFSIIDSEKDQLLLILRPTPFDLNSWEALRSQTGWSYTYDDTQRMGVESLMTDEDQVYTWFLAGGNSGLAGIQGAIKLFGNSSGKVPVYDRNLIEKYGFKALEKTTQYLELLNQNDASGGQIDPAKQREYNSTRGSLLDMLEAKTAQLYYWFGYEDFLRGSIPTVGRIGDDAEWGVRLGSVLTRKRDGLQMYITGIEQNWNMDGDWTTNITVERGHYSDEYRKWIRQEADVRLGVNL